MQGTEHFTTGPYKAVRRLVGVREVLTIPYEAYNALLKLQAPTIPQPILLMCDLGVAAVIQASSLR